MLTATAGTGLVVLVLELPTSGVADAYGRRPVLALSALFNIAAAVVFGVADSFAIFAVSALLAGVFRALDSGPLEAWFVDTLHASTPGADVDRPLSRAGVVLGLSMGAGALTSGFLIWWDPVAGWDALTLPVVLWIAFSVVHLLAVVTLVREPRGSRTEVTDHSTARQVVREGVRMLRWNRVLLGVVMVEVFWSVGMVVFELLQPVRLAEMLGSEDQAAALMGPITAAGWGVFALGSALAGMTSNRIGVARTAILARVLNGLGAVVMGLVAGPVALIAAYAVTFSLHGGAGPMHASLLHREATSRNRSTVLSMNSMVSFATFTVAAPIVGILAEAASTQVAMVSGGLFSVVGAALYLPARRAELTRSSPPDTEHEIPTDAEAGTAQAD